MTGPEEALGRLLAAGGPAASDEVLSSILARRRRRRERQVRLGGAVVATALVAGAAGALLLPGRTRSPSTSAVAGRPSREALRGIAPSEGAASSAPSPGSTTTSTVPGYPPGGATGIASTPTDSGVVLASASGSGDQVSVVAAAPAPVTATGPVHGSATATSTTSTSSPSRVRAPKRRGYPAAASTCPTAGSAGSALVKVAGRVTAFELVVPNVAGSTNPPASSDPWLVVTALATGNSVVVVGEVAPGTGEVQITFPDGTSSSLMPASNPTSTTAPGASSRAVPSGEWFAAVGAAGAGPGATATVGLTADSATGGSRSRSAIAVGAMQVLGDICAVLP